MQPNEDKNTWRPNDVPAEEARPQVDVQTPYQSQYDGFDMTAPAVFPEQQVVAGEQLIEWEASEYIHHEKDMSWFVLLGIGSLMLTGLALVFRQWTFAILIVVLGVAIALFAHRPPRTLHYALDLNGIRINDRLYTYSEFRAFGVLNEGPLYSIVLLPIKRFMPATSMFFEPQDGEKIVDILGARLPMETVKADPIDTLTRKLRF